MHTKKRRYTKKKKLDLKKSRQQWYKGPYLVKIRPTTTRKLGWYTQVVRARWKRKPIKPIKKRRRTGQRANKIKNIYRQARVKLNYRYMYFKITTVKRQATQARANKAKRLYEDMMKRDIKRGQRTLMQQSRHWIMAGSLWLSLIVKRRNLFAHLRTVPQCVWRKKFSHAHPHAPYHKYTINKIFNSVKKAHKRYFVRSLHVRLYQTPGNARPHRTLYGHVFKGVQKRLPIKSVTLIKRIAHGYRRRARRRREKKFLQRLRVRKLRNAHPSRI